MTTLIVTFPISYNRTDIEKMAGKEFASYSDFISHIQTLETLETLDDIKDFEKVKYYTLLEFTTLCNEEEFNADYCWVNFVKILD